MAAASASSRGSGCVRRAVNWNRDGSRLAFTADSSYRNERKYGASQIFTRGDDGKVRRVTTDTDYCLHRCAVLARRSLDSHNAPAVDRRGHSAQAELTAGDRSRAHTRRRRHRTKPDRRLGLSPRRRRCGVADGRYVYFTGGVGGATHRLPCLA